MPVGEGDKVKPASHEIVTCLAKKEPSFPKLGNEGY